MNPGESNAAVPVATAPSEQPYRWLIRLTENYFLNAIGQITQAIKCDLISSLLFLAIIRANLELVPARARVLPDPDTLIEDRDRQPVSVYGLAQTLSLPYETVRRHIKRMVAAGLCEKTDRGIIVPAAVITSPAVLTLIINLASETRDYVGLMIEAGLDIPQAHVEPGWQAPGPVARLAAGYLLDSQQLLMGAVKIDFISGLIFLEINYLNTMHFSKDKSLASAYSGLTAVLPNDQRRPVSVYQLARRLRLPYETCRRHVLKLQSVDLCERGATGKFIIPARTVARSDIMAVTAAAGERARQFAVDLAQLSPAGP